MSNKPETIVVDCTRCRRPVSISFRPSVREDWRRGIMEAVKSTGAYCDLCKAEEAAIDKSELEKRRKVLAVEISGIPEGYQIWNRELGNVALMDWASKNRNAGIFLGSPSGKNKTRVLCRVLSRMIEIGEIAPESARFYRMVDLRKELIRLHDRTEAEERRFLEVLRVVPLLFLDDFDKVEFTGATAEMIYGIIDGRVASRRRGRLWITSNSGGRGLIQSITRNGMGEARARAIVARLEELCEEAPRDVF